MKHELTLALAQPSPSSKLVSRFLENAPPRVSQRDRRSVAQDVLVYVPYM